MHKPMICVSTKLPRLIFINESQYLSLSLRRSAISKIIDILAPGVSVIDRKFCYPYAVNLLVVPAKGSLKHTTLNVVDVRGNLLFKVVKGSSLLMNTDSLIVDAAGSSTGLLRRKTFSVDQVWRVYRGKHGSKEAALFKVTRREGGLGLDVFTAASDDPKKEMMGEFYVRGRLLPTFYLNQCVIACVRKMSDKEGGGLELLVNQEIDCALILAPLVIHGEMGRWRMDDPKTAPPPPPRPVQRALVHSAQSRKNEDSATAAVYGSGGLGVASAVYFLGSSGYGGGGGGGGGCCGGGGGGGCGGGGGGGGCPAF